LQYLSEVNILKTFDAIFVTPRGFEHEVAGEIITFVSHGEKFCGHSAIRFPDIDGVPKMIEAVTAGVGFSPYDKYDGEPCMTVLTIEVTDEQYSAMVEEAKRIDAGDYSYGWKECAAGGIADNLGETIGEAVSFILHCEGNSMDCSEVYTRIIRKACVRFLDGYDANAVTPERAFKNTLIQSVAGNLKVVKVSYPE